MEAATNQDKQSFMSSSKESIVLTEALVVACRSRERALGDRRIRNRDYRSNYRSRGLEDERYRRDARMPGRAALVGASACLDARVIRCATATSAAAGAAASASPGSAFAAGSHQRVLCFERALDGNPAPRFELVVGDDPHVVVGGFRGATGSAEKRKEHGRDGEFHLESSSK
jgi:hypothetical protein